MNTLKRHYHWVIAEIIFVEMMVRIPSRIIVMIMISFGVKEKA